MLARKCPMRPRCSLWCTLELSLLPPCSLALLACPILTWPVHTRFLSSLPFLCLSLRFLFRNCGDLLGKFNHYRLIVPLVGRRKWDRITSLKVSSLMFPLIVLKLTTLLAIILSYQIFQAGGNLIPPPPF